MKIASFGDQNQELEAVNLVELSLTKSGTDFKTTLNAFAVPHICNDLQGQDLEWVKKRYPSLENIEFADVCAASSTIQIEFFFVFIYFGHTNNYNTLHLQFIKINSNYQIDLLIGSDYI